MNAKLLTKSKFFVKHNASTILTCVGTVGVVASVILTAKASPKALKALENAKEEKGEDLTVPEVIKAAAPAYIPVVLTGAATIACIFGANILNKRQQASLVSAYALLDNSYKKYKKKVKELYGEDADIQVKTEIAKDNYEQNTVKPSADTKLYYDEFSGRYFESTDAIVQKAEYNLNRDIVMRQWVTINDFYKWLELDPIESGDELGWTPDMNLACYWQEWVDFNHHKVIMDDGLECIILSIFQQPLPDYEEYL